MLVMRVLPVLDLASHWTYEDGSVGGWGSEGGEGHARVKIVLTRMKTLPTLTVPSELMPVMVAPNSAPSFPQRAWTFVPMIDMSVYVV